MTFLADAFGPTRPPVKQAPAGQNSHAINRTRKQSAIEAENAKMAARLSKIQGRATSKGKKKSAGKKPGNNGQGGSARHDSGLSMEQEWKRCTARELR